MPEGPAALLIQMAAQATPTRYLTRARLRRDVSASAIRALLVPRGESARVLAGHRIVWTLFGDDPDRRRDFLWREAEPGVYYLLSERPPEDRHALFHLDEPKRFAPELRPGDRLHFALRVNATVARRPDGSAARGKPCDIVMDALYRLPKDVRADDRRRLIGEVAEQWLTRQGEKAGFRLAAVHREERGTEGQGVLMSAGYRTLSIERSGRPARIGVLDLEGDLEIREPAAFVAALASGFGRAKAFGCGLMLVRRA